MTSEWLAYVRPPQETIYTLPASVMIVWQSSWSSGPFYAHFSSCLTFLISNNNIKVSSMSCGNTRKAIILLVRKLYTVMQYLGPLPENVYLNMKLAYYDDGNTHIKINDFCIINYIEPAFFKALNIFIIIVFINLLCQSQQRLLNPVF